MLRRAASGEPAAATRAFMSGGFAEPISEDGLYECPALDLKEVPALEDMEETAESIEGFRCAVGRGST